MERESFITVFVGELIYLRHELRRVNNFQKYTADSDERAELQKRVEEKTERIFAVNQRIDFLQKEGTGNSLATWANVAARILVMLLEAWMVHWLFVRRKNFT